jgi:hopene-associated glycosyltransferase HpnB
VTFDFTLSAIGLAAWLYLVAARGGFWRADIHEEQENFSDPPSWPSVMAVVPARNEAELIPTSLPSLLTQDYPGPFTVFLVDDQSDDGTSAAAKRAAAAINAQDRLEVLEGRPLPLGWTGKLWAVQRGAEEASQLPEPPRYLLLTDADIAYGAGTLARLVKRAEARGLSLTSLMVKLRCESLAERALIPSFVFFFQMLYPFAWVNRPSSRMAAAAGGCMLVRLDALKAAGGIEAIHNELIDDCALGRKLKRQGPIWLGLTNSAHSLRPYPAFGDIMRMVSRSAFAQLNYSPVLLAGTAAGMTLVYLLPPVFAFFGTGAVQAAGLATWALMTAAFAPILRFYKQTLLWAPALPVIAGCYMLFTLDSALLHWRGKGGLWKGRVQARRAEAS